MKATVEVEWGIFVQCDIFVQGHMQVILNEVYTSDSSHIVHCREFILGSCLMSSHEVIGICGIYVAFEGIFVAGTYMDLAW